MGDVFLLLQVKYRCGIFYFHRQACARRKSSLSFVVFNRTDEIIINGTIDNKFSFAYVQLYFKSLHFRRASRLYVWSLRFCKNFRLFLQELGLSKSLSYHPKVHIVDIFIILARTRMKRRNVTKENIHILIENEDLIESSYFSAIFALTN